MSKLLAIVPAYNESGAIAGTVTDVLDNAPGFDVVVVDDGSTDDTGTVARQAGAAVIHHPFNIGIGGAVQSGYQYALDHDYDVAVQVDGDGQHDARYIPELLAMLRSDPRLNMVSGRKCAFSAMAIRRAARAAAHRGRAARPGRPRSPRPKGCGRIPHPYLC